jgi:hypothetical protein
LCALPDTELVLLSPARLPFRHSRGGCCASVKLRVESGIGNVKDAD